MKNQYKYLAFDVDNTITNSCQVIPDETANIFNSLNEELIFISGANNPELRRMVSSKLSRKHHLMGNTGTHHILINHDNSEEEIHNRLLPENDKSEIIAALQSLKQEYDLIPHTSEEDQILDRGSQITLSILGRNADFNTKKCYDPDNAKRNEFIKHLTEILGENKYQLKIGGGTSIDITKGKWDKGLALKEFLEDNNLQKEEMLFFGDQLGDGGNDFPVIKTGIKCIGVKSPRETISILRTLI